MKKKIIYIVLTLTIIAIAAVRLESNKEATAERVYHFDKDQAINVQAIPLKLETADNDISYTGTFEPNRETRLSADIQGKVNSMLVDVGNYVRKGQALIQLDNSLLKLQLQAVEIQIEALEAAGPEDVAQRVAVKVGRGHRVGDDEIGQVVVVVDQVLDGEGEVVIGGQIVNPKCGETVLIPANVPHSVNARQRFKMLLTMIRG